MTRHLGACALLALCLARPALGFELVEDRVFVNTYGTIGVSTLDDPDARWYRHTAPTGPRLTNRTQMAYDTRAGLQVEARLSEGLDVVWQGLLHRDLSDDTRVDTQWAYLRYRPTDWMDIKLGRFLTPFYQISEQMYVGYTQPWVRPPREVYGLVGQVDHTDGIAVRFRLPTDAFSTTVDMTVGQYSTSESGIELAVRPLITTVLTVARDEWTVRAMAARAPLHASGAYLESLNALLNQPGASHRYDLTEEKDTWYFNLGFKYQSADWLASAEYVNISANNNHAIAESHAYNLTLGHTWGQTLPYITYSRLDVTNTEPETGLTGLAGFTAQQLIDARKNDQRTIGVGVRWDFHPGYALKAQVDWIKTPDGHRGMFEQDPGRTVQVFSLALDWAL